MPEQFDLVIVGMGSAGIAAAELASTLDLRVAAVERGWPGGDALWSGSIPVASLHASAKAAHAARRAGELGIDVGEVRVDLPAVWRRIRDVRARIAAVDDDPQRFVDRGIEVVHGTARLTGPDEVTVRRERAADLVLSTRFVLVCTGAAPVWPGLSGLDEVPHLTGETLFELERPPRSLAVVGGGPSGVAIAQGCARLGITTTLLQRAGSILVRDERSLTAALAARLRAEGVDLRLGATVTGARPHGDGVAVSFDRAGSHDVVADAVLLATGRAPAIDGLGLDEVGIEHGPGGIVVDERGRTAIRSVYAVGDVTERLRFPHAAVRAVRDMFFPGKPSVDDLVPWCTFTDPELARVGLTSAEAEERYGDDVETWRIDLDQNDRARIDGTTTGAVVVVTAKERIVGGHVLAPAAGEVVHELALAMRQGLKLGELASVVHLHPTISSSIGDLGAEAASEKAVRYRWLVRRR